GKAAECLAHACRLAPSDAGLVHELVNTRMLAGDRDGAIADLGGALAAGAWPTSVRAALLRQRSDLARAAGHTAAALADLEEVGSLVGAEIVPELVALLEEHLDALARSPSADAEATRKTLARLVSILEETGDGDKLRALLERWTETRADDVFALRKL